MGALHAYTLKPTMGPGEWTCDECGSNQVVQRCYVNMNTGEPVSDGCNDQWECLKCDLDCDATFWPDGEDARLAAEVDADDAAWREQDKASRLANEEPPEDFYDA